MFGGIFFFFSIFGGFVWEIGYICGGASQGRIGPDFTFNVVAQPWRLADFNYKNISKL